jgi:hypothetical protein
MKLIQFDPENPNLERDLAFTFISLLAKFKLISQKTFMSYQLTWKVFRPRKGDF